MVTLTAPHCGTHVSTASLQLLSGSLQAAKILETSRTREGFRTLQEQEVISKETQALEIARTVDIESLLERFLANPAQIRSEIRVKLGEKGLCPFSFFLSFLFSSCLIL